MGQLAFFDLSHIFLGQSMAPPPVLEMRKALSRGWGLGHDVFWVHYVLTRIQALGFSK
jgi:hypothetical protein